MSTSDPRGIKIAPTTEESTADELTAFVESVTDALGAVEEIEEDAVEEIEATGKALADAVDGLETTVRKLHGEVEDLREDTDDLASDVEAVDEDQERAALERAQDRQRISDIEDRLDDVEGATTEDADPTPGSPEHQSTTPRTPLERVVSVPEVMAEDELTANVRRARFVAMDVLDYTTKVRAGRVITAGELRRVVTAGTDAKGHSQTVDRIIEVLDGMGDDAVEVVERRGERRVVFDEDAAERLDALGGDGPDGEGHDVVMEGRA